ncbi:MAG: FAD-dependent oxidoreductase [Paraglaciecola sp.]|uniref:FAD-dependent oxidoreductase n=1 Tax=Paraglaciecola sp. TaxID=1920173 RepID=UPI0032970EF4
MLNNPLPLRDNEEVLIVGGGLIGVTLLYVLTQQGVPARLFELHDALANETSFANGGMLTPSMPEPWNSPGVWKHLLSSLFEPTSAMKLRLKAIPSLTGWGLTFLSKSNTTHYMNSSLANLKLAAYSTELTTQLQSTLGFNCDYSKGGSLKVFSDAKSYNSALSSLTMLRENGLEVKELDAKQSVVLEPQLESFSSNIVGSLYYPDDRRGDARKFTQQLAEHAKALGAQVHLNTKVKKLVLQDRKVLGIETREGQFYKGQVVIANGYSAPEIAKQAGIHLPIKPVKGYSLTIDASALGDLIPKVPVIDDAMHAAVVPLGSSLRAVGTAEFTNLDRKQSKARVNNLGQLLRRLYPSIHSQLDVKSGEQWAGFRPMSADGKPFIGQSPVPGLWLNCGHGHLGWTKALGSAHILVDTMLGNTPEIASQPFSYGFRDT